MVKRNRRLDAFQRRREQRDALALALSRTALLRGPSANLERSTGGSSGPTDAAAGLTTRESALSAVVTFLVRWLRG